MGWIGRMGRMGGKGRMGWMGRIGRRVGAETCRIVQRPDGVGQRRHPDDLEPGDDRRFAGVSRRQQQSGQAVAPRRHRDGQHAARHVYRSVERQLAEQHEVGDQPPFDDPGRGEDAQRDRQVERRSRLAHVGGGQVDGDPVRRKLEPGVADRAAHAIAALADAGVRQTDHGERRKAEADVDLHMHRARVDTEHRRRPQTRQHAPASLQGRALIVVARIFNDLQCRRGRRIAEFAIDRYPDCTILYRLFSFPGVEPDMLDAFKSMTGGKNKLVQQQADELELLISTAREERSAISAMLTALTARTAKLAPLGKTLEQVSDKAAGVTSRLDEITKRLSGLDDRTKELTEIEKRIQTLKDAARQAEQTTQKALGPDGELQKHREAVQHLSSQALGTQATLDTLKKERATLEELRGQLQKADAEVKQSLGQSSTLKTELDQIRAVATTLTQDYAKIRETSREAREDTTAAMTTVKEVENKLGPLARLHELSQSTEERLTSINALAEHVSHKAKALESQQQAVEHAVVQANRVNEMVWAMDVQIGKLNEGMKQIARADDTLARTEKLAAETNAQLESATKLRHETERETGKLKKEAGTLLDAVRGQVDTLALKEKEFESFDLRLRTLHGDVGDAEARMEALAAKDKNLIELSQKIDGMSKRFEALFTSADELTKKQLALENLNERLGQVDELAKKTSWQLDSLRQSRQDLDALRKEIQEFYTSHGEAAKLADKLGADRVGQLRDRKSTRLNSSHMSISYAVFCLKKKKQTQNDRRT